MFFVSLFLIHMTMHTRFCDKYGPCWFWYYRNVDVNVL